MLEAVVRWSAAGFEAGGVAAIVAVTAAAGVRLSRAMMSNGDFTESLSAFRADVGRGVLLGLELLVAADILRTVAAPPNFENIAALGLVVLIRTFLSLSLGIEIEGIWPWRRREMDNRRHGSSAG